MTPFKTYSVFQNPLFQQMSTLKQPQSLLNSWLSTDVRSCMDSISKMKTGYDAFPPMTTEISLVMKSLMETLTINSAKIRDTYSALPLQQIQSQLEAINCSLPMANSQMSEVLQLAQEPLARATANIRDMHTSFAATQRYLENFRFTTIGTLAHELFGPKVRDYFRNNPLTRDEWESTVAEITQSDDFNTTGSLDPSKIENTVSDPSENRLLLAKYIFIFIFLTFFATVAQVGSGECKNILSKVAMQFAAFFLIPFAGFYAFNAHTLWPVIQKQWENQRKPPPLAEIKAPRETIVHVHKTANPHSPIIDSLCSGQLVQLMPEGTQTMKAIVADIDDEGNPIATGWVSRKSLRRVKIKEAYALKKIATDKIDQIQVQLRMYVP